MFPNVVFTSTFQSLDLAPRLPADHVGQVALAVDDLGAGGEEHAELGRVGVAVVAAAVVAEAVALELSVDEEFYA